MPILDVLEQLAGQPPGALLPPCAGCVGSGLDADGDPCRRCGALGVELDPAAPVAVTS